MTEVVGRNTTVRVYYYQPNNVVSGLDIVFDVWEETGIALYSSVPATELDSRGLYYADILTPNADVYIFGVGRESDSDLKSPFVFDLIIKNLNSEFKDEVIMKEENWHLMWVDSDDL